MVNMKDRYEDYLKNNGLKDYLTTDDLFILDDMNKDDEENEDKDTESDDNDNDEDD